MKPIFERYKDKQVLINATGTVNSEVMTLFLVADDYFGVVNTENGYRAYFPYSTILGVYESLDGTLSINLNKFVEYKGSVGYSIMF